LFCKSCNDPISEISSIMESLWRVVNHIQNADLAIDKRRKTF
jgi:hypothetical protein